MYTSEIDLMYDYEKIFKKKGWDIHYVQGRGKGLSPMNICISKNTNDGQICFYIYCNWGRDDYGDFYSCQINDSSDAEYDYNAINYKGFEVSGRGFLLFERNVDKFCKYLEPTLNEIATLKVNIEESKKSTKKSLKESELTLNDLSHMVHDGIATDITWTPLKELQKLNLFLVKEIMKKNKFVGALFEDEDKNKYVILTSASPNLYPLTTYCYNNDRYYTNESKKSTKKSLKESTDEDFSLYDLNKHDPFIKEWIRNINKELADVSIESIGDDEIVFRVWVDESMDLDVFDDIVTSCMPRTLINFMSDMNIDFGYQFVYEDDKFIENDFVFIRFVAW